MGRSGSSNFSPQTEIAKNVLLGFLKSVFTKFHAKDSETFDLVNFRKTKALTHHLRQILNPFEFFRARSKVLKFSEQDQEDGTYKNVVEISSTKNTRIHLPLHIDVPTTVYHRTFTKS